MEFSKRTSRFPNILQAYVDLHGDEDLLRAVAVSEKLAAWPDTVAMERIGASPAAKKCEDKGLNACTMKAASSLLSDGIVEAARNEVGSCGHNNALPCAIAGAQIAKFNLLIPRPRSLKSALNMLSEACAGGVAAACRSAAKITVGDVPALANHKDSLAFLTHGCELGSEASCQAIAEVWRKKMELNAEAQKAEATCAVSPAWCSEDHPPRKTLRDRILSTGFYESDHFTEFESAYFGAELNRICQSGVVAGCYAYGTGYARLPGATTRSDNQKNIQAKKYLQKACAGGMVEACQSLAYRLNQKDFEVPLGDAVEFLRQSCNDLNGRACLGLAARLKDYERGLDAFALQEAGLDRETFLQRACSLNVGRSCELTAAAVDPVVQEAFVAAGRTAPDVRACELGDRAACLSVAALTKESDHDLYIDALFFGCLSLLRDQSPEFHLCHNANEELGSE